MKFRVMYWNDREDHEVFGKTYEAADECNAEEMFYADEDCQSAIEEFDDTYPMLINNLDKDI